MTHRKTTITIALLATLSVTTAFAQEPAVTADNNRSASQAAAPQTATVDSSRVALDSEAGQPLLVIDDQSGTLGRIERPARLGEPNSLQAMDPTEVGVTEFVRFQDAENRPRLPRDGARNTARPNN